jgi:sorbitol-specific phosphotransferase system component IIC
MTAEPLLPVEIAPVKDKSGLGIASLVLGLISLCGAWFPYVNYCLILFVLAGIVTGILGLNSSKKGLAIAGLVLSVLSLCAVIASIVFWTSVGAALLQDPTQWQDFLNQMNY